LFILLTLLLSYTDGCSSPLSSLPMPPTRPPKSLLFFDLTAAVADQCIYTPRRLDMATLLCRLFVILMTAMCSHALHNESSVGVTEDELGWASLRRSWGRRGLAVTGCVGSTCTVYGCTNMLTSSTTLSACNSYCAVRLFTFEMFIRA
jgi:hypothetical protein